MRVISLGGRRGTLPHAPDSIVEGAAMGPLEAKWPWEGRDAPTLAEWSADEQTTAEGSSSVHGTLQGA